MNSSWYACSIVLNRIKQYSTNNHRRTLQSVECAQYYLNKYQKNPSSNPSISSGKTALGAIWVDEKGNNNSAAEPLQVINIVITG